MIEELRYQPEGRGFESWWGHWIFSNLPNPSSRTMAMRVYTASNRNEYQKIFRWGGGRGGKALPARKAPSSVSRLSKKCRILDVSQPYWPPRPVTGIALLLNFLQTEKDHLYGLVVRDPSYRSRGPGSIPGTPRFSEYWIWNGVHSALWVQLRSYLQEIAGARV
jgi:hypothetical protein